MENPPASKCPATNRSDDIQDPLRNDIRLGGEGEYQQLREGSSYCKWLELVGFFVQSHRIRSGFIPICIIYLAERRC